MNIYFTIISNSYLISKSLSEIIIEEFGSVSVVNNLNDFDDFLALLRNTSKKCFIVDWIFLENFSHSIENLNEEISHIPIFLNSHQLRKFSKYENYIMLNDDKRKIADKLHKFVEPLNRQIEEDNGSNELSKREKLILQLVAKGDTTKAIADKLNISSMTVSSHRKNICAKLGIKTISGLTAYAIINGLVELNES
ncbi:MAG: LuxR C-terminal-related transcriptional regulator [Candidatus Kapaibacterium sp.]